MRVLVVEDEVIVGLALREEFLDRGVEVMVAHDAEGALQLLNLFPFDAAVIDVALPRMRGDQLVRELRRVFPHIPIVLSTGLHASEVSKIFTGDARLDVVEKPHDFGVIMMSLERMGLVLAC